MKHWSPCIMGSPTIGFSTVVHEDFSNYQRHTCCYCASIGMDNEVEWSLALLAEDNEVGGRVKQSTDSDVDLELRATPSTHH